MSATPINPEHRGPRATSENVTAPQSAPFVLHIRPDPPNGISSSRPTTLDREDASVGALLESVSLREAACPDVYRGLARLLRPGSRTPVAVFVCIDDLGSREMEFFSIVSRRRPGLLVYVYGQPVWESRITQAVGLGAAGLVTEEAIRRLARVDTPLPVQESREQPQAESMAADRPATQETVPSDEPPVSCRQAQPSEPGQSGPEPIEQQPSEQVVRVPWLRYADRPARTGPPKPPPPPMEDPAEPAPEGAPPGGLPEPLLTDEELQALIGEDDIAALAPEPGDPLPPATPSGEGRES